MHDKLLSSKKHHQEFKYLQYYYNSGSSGPTECNET